MYVSDQVARILQKAKVKVVSETVIRERNERGHYKPGTKIELVLKYESRM